MGAYRQVELQAAHALHDVLAALHREQLGQRLLVPRLAPESAARLVYARAGVLVAAAVVDRIERETAGNPFYIEEVVRQLRTSGRDLGDPSSAETGWDVPEGVRDVLALRLARLSPRAVRLLRAAATLGERSRFDVLADVAESTDRPPLDELDEVLAAGMLVEDDDGYHFAHALIRQTIEAGLSRARRQHLHLLAARALTDAYSAGPEPHLAELARHYRLAGPAAADAAIDYTARAARAAGAVFAWEDAALQWRIALSLLHTTDVQRRAEFQLELGVALWRAGELDAARAALEAAAVAARQAGDAPLLARTILDAGQAASTSGVIDHGVIARLEQALHELPAEALALRARLNARYALELVWSGERERVLALSAEAVVLARRSGDALALAEALRARHNALYGPEHVDERLALAQDLLALAVRQSDRQLALHAQGARLQDLLETGEVSEAEDAIEAYRRLADELRLPVYRWISLWHRGLRALRQGAFAEAERLADEVLTLGRRIGRPDAPMQYTALAFRVCLESGRLDEIEPLLREFAGRFPQQPVWRAALALACCELGRRDDAAHALADLARDDFAALAIDPLDWLASAALLAQVCAALAATRPAATLYRLLAPYAARNVVAGASLDTYGSVERYLGLLAATMGRRTAATRHFDRALVRNRQMEMPAVVARSQFEYARMLMERREASDWERAVALLSEARATALALGLTRLGAEIEALAAPSSLRGEGRLVAMGASGGVTLARPVTAAQPSQPVAPDSDLPRPDRLTAREGEVLRHLASGMTSRAIAARLVLSVPTVNRHIANLYHKIGARSRAEATAYALRFGLVEFIKS